MKKSILSIFAVCAIVFSSCTDNPNTVGGEDKGTSTETQVQTSEVNPNHIRGYGDQSSNTDANSMYAQRADQVTSQMATDLQLDEQTQQRVMQVNAKHERRMGELETRYNYSETARMGGEANNDTENDMNNNTNTIMDANRQNNAGNDYAGNEEMDRVGAENMRPSEANMNTERSQIMQETEKELQQVLSPEQFNKYKQNRDSYYSHSATSGASGSQMNAGSNQSADGASNSQMNSGNNQSQSQNQTGNIQQEQKKQNQRQ